MIRASLVGAAVVVPGGGVGGPRAAAVTLVTFVLLAAIGVAAGALVYRWYFLTAIPEGVAVLLGVSVVAVYLNTTSLGALVSAENAALLTLEAVVFDVAALGLAAVVSPVARYAADRLAVDVFAFSGADGRDGDVSRIVGAVGRTTTVTLPAAAAIGDIDAYEPVAAEKKAEMAERTMRFRRRLTAAELREQLVERVKDEYGVGYVDVDVTDDGTLGYFAVGSRVTGLGPTLAPGRVAVALAADPPNNATAGDMVQVWRTDPGPERVATGELRGVAGDVATVALDESDAEAFSVEGGYRLVTLPTEPQADREFASLLRNADETMATVIVEADSDLVGTTVGEVRAVVAAVRPAEGAVQPIPPRGYAFAAEDTAFLVGRPDAIRRLEADATRNETGGVAGSEGVGPDPAEPDRSAEP